MEAPWPDPFAVKCENEYFGAILAFNTPVLKEAASVADNNNIKIFKSKIIYKLPEKMGFEIRSKC